MKVASVVLCFFLGLGALAAEPPRMEVVLLGTGSPVPDADRAGPSTAIVIGDKLFVVDAGRGVIMRLAAIRPRISRVDAVFLTHLHSDHTSGLPDLFNTTWVMGRKTPLEVYGPEGVGAMTDAVLKFYEADIHIRRDLVENLPAAGATFHPHVVQEGVVYKDAEVTVTAFRVDHGLVEPAFGYKFESGGRTIVISGDTTVSENLIRYAHGADVLVHEAYMPGFFEQHSSKEVAKRLSGYHTSADDVGKVAQRAGVKLLVLSHLVPGTGEEEYLRRAAVNFKGKIVVGRDLMRF